MSQRDREKRKPKADKGLSSTLQQTPEQIQQRSPAERDPAVHTAVSLQDSIGNQAVLEAISGVEQAGLAGLAGEALELGLAGVDTQELMPGTGSMSVMRAQLHAELRERAGLEAPDPTIASRIGHRRGRPLPPAVRARMEQAFGHDFDHVRVHTDPEAARTARELEAHAFTAQSDIWFGPGEFAPDTPRGEQLLAHELAHVVQADQGKLRPTGSGLQVSDPSDRAEHEAETMGRLAVARMASPPDLASAPARMPIDSGWSQAPLHEPLEAMPVLALPAKAAADGEASTTSPQTRGAARASSDASVMRKASKGGARAGKRSKPAKRGARPGADREPTDRKELGAGDVAEALAGVIAKMLPREDEPEQGSERGAPTQKGRTPGRGPTAGPGKPEAKDKTKDPDAPGSPDGDKELTPQEKLRQVLEGQAPPPGLDDLDISPDQLGKAIQAIPGAERERLGNLADRRSAEPPQAEDLLGLLGPEVLQIGADALQRAVDETVSLTDAQDELGDLLDMDMPLGLDFADIAGSKLTAPKAPDARAGLSTVATGAKPDSALAPPKPQPSATGTPAKGPLPTTDPAKPAAQPGTPDASKTAGKGDEAAPATDASAGEKAKDGDAKEADAKAKEKDKDKDKKKADGKKGGSESDKMSQKEIRAEIKRLTILKDYAGIDLEWLDTDMTGKQLLMGSKQQVIAKIQAKLDRNKDQSDKRQKLLQGRAKAAQDGGKPVPGPDADANLRFMGLVGKRLPKQMQGIQKKVTVIQGSADKIAKQQEEKQQEISDLEERIAELQKKLKSGGGGAKGPEDWPKICEELNKQLEKKEKQELKDQEKDQKAEADLDKKIKQLDKDILAHRQTKQDSADSKKALETELSGVKTRITSRKKAITDEAAASAAATSKDAATKTPKAKAPSPATDETVKTLGKQQKSIEQKIKKAEQRKQKAEVAEKKAVADKKKAEEDLKKKKEAIKERTKTLEEMVDAKKNLTDGIDVPHIYADRFELKLKMFYYPFGHRPWSMEDRGKSKADLDKLNKEYQDELEKKKAEAKKAKETGERTLGDATGTDKAKADAAKKEADKKKKEEKKPLSKEEQDKKDAEEAKKKEDVLLRKASNYKDLAPDKREKAMRELAESELKKPVDPAAVQAKVAEIKQKLDDRVKAVDAKMKSTPPFRLDDGTVVDLKKGPIPDSLVLNPEVAKKIGFSVEDLKRHKEELERQAFAKKARTMLFGPDSKADPQTAVDMLHKYGGERKMSPQQMLDHLTFAGKGSLPPELQGIKTNIDAYNAKDKDFQAKYGQVPIPKQKPDSKGMVKMGPMLEAIAENSRRMAELEKKRLEAGQLESTLASNKKIAANIGVTTPDEADAYVKTLMSTCQIPEAEARRRMETPGDPKITTSPLPAADVAARMNAIRLMPAGKARSEALKDLTDKVPPKFLLGALLRQSEDGVNLVKGHVANPQLQDRIQAIEKLPKDQQYNAYRNLSKMTDMPVHELRLSTHNKTKKDAVLGDASKVMSDPKLSKEEREKKMAEMAKAHNLTKKQFQDAYDKTIRATEEALAKYKKTPKDDDSWWSKPKADPTTKAIDELSRHDLDPDELERKIQEVSRLTGVSPADLRRYAGFKSLETARKDIEERVNMGKGSYDKMLEQGRKYSPAKTPQQMMEHLRNVPWDQCPKELRWAKQEIGKFDYRNPGKDKGAGADLAMYRKKAKLKRGETFERLETDPAKIMKMPANTVAEAEAKKKAWDEYVAYTKKRDRLISKLDETIVEDDDAYNYLKAMSSKERAALLNDPGAHDEDSARIKASFLDGCNHDPYHTWGKRMFEEAAYYNEALDKGVQEKADAAAKTAADDEKRRKENEEAARLLADTDTKGKKAEPLNIQDVNAHIDALCRTHGWSRQKAVAELKKTGGGEPAVKMVASLYTMKKGEPSPALKWELDRVNKLPDAERAASMARLQKWTGLKNSEIKTAQGKLTIQNHVLKTMAATEQLSDKEKDKVLRKLAEELGKDPTKAADLAEIKALYAKAKAEGLDKISNTPGFRGHIESLDKCAPGDLERKVAEVAKATGLTKEEVMRFAQARRHDKVKDKVAGWVGKDKGGVDKFQDEAQKRNMTLEEFANYLAKSNPKDLPADLHGIQGRIKADKSFPVQWTEAESKARKKAMGDPDDPTYKKKKNELIAQLMGDHDDDKILNAFGSMSLAERKLFIEEWNAMRAAGARMGNQSMPDLREAFYDALQCDDEDRGIELLNVAEKYNREDALKDVNTDANSGYSKKRDALLDEMQSPYGPNAAEIKRLFKSMTHAERAQFMRDQDDLISAANKELEQKMRKPEEVPKQLATYLSGDHEFQVMVGDADKARRADFTFEQSKQTQAIEKKVKQTDEAVKLLNWKGDRNQAYALVEQMSKKYELSTDNMLRLLAGERLVDESSKIPAHIARNLRTPKSRGGDTVAGIAMDAMRRAGHDPSAAKDAEVTDPNYAGKLAGFRADAKKVIEKQQKLQKFLDGQWMNPKDVLGIVYGCNPRELAMLDKQLPGGLAALMSGRKNKYGRSLPGIQGEQAIELRALIKKGQDYTATAKEDQLVLDLKTMDPRKSADPGTPEGLAARLAWAKDLPPDQRLAELNKLAPLIAKDAGGNPAEAITKAFLRGSIGGEANVLTGPMAQQVQAAAGLPQRERDEFLKQLSMLGGYADVKALETAAKNSQSNLKAAAEYQKILALPAGAERIEKLDKLFSETKLTEGELDRVLQMAEENGMLQKPVKPVPERVSAELDRIKELVDPKERQAKLKELARLWGLSVPDLVAHVNKKADEARKHRELKGQAGREADEIRRKIKKGDEDEIKKIIKKYGNDPEHFKLILEQYPEGAGKLKKALRDEFGKNDSDCVDLMALIDRAEKFTPKPELPEGVTEDVSKELQSIMRDFPSGNERQNEARRQAIAQFQVAKGLNDGDMSMVQAHAEHQVKYFDEELERHKRALDAEVNGSWLYVSDDRIAEIVKRMPHEMLVALAEKYPKLMKATLDGIGGDVYDDVKHKLDTGRMAQKLPYEERKQEISKARVDYKAEKLREEFDAWFTVDRDRIRELLGDCSEEEMRMLDEKFGGRLQQELDEAMKPTLFECAVAVVAVAALVVAAVLVPGVGAALLVGALAAASAVGATGTLYGMGRDSETLAIKGRIGASKTDPQGNYELDKGKVDESIDQLQNELNSTLWVSDSALYGALARLNPRELMSLRERMGKPPPEGVQITDSDGNVLTLEGLIQKHIGGDEKAKAVAMMKDAEDHLSKRDRRTELKEVARDLVIKDRMAELRREPGNSRKSPEEIYKLAVADSKLLNAKIEERTKKIKDSANSLFKAIDGWGDDEKTVLKTIAGLSPEEMDLVKVEYRRHFGKDLETQMREDMGLGDWQPGQTFEPGGFWTSHFTDQNEGRIALMMMSEEHRVEGLREFMLEYSERAWGDDEDLIFQTLENMSTEERTKLVSGPEGRDFLERVKEDLADNERHMVDALTLIDPKTGKAELNKAAVAAAKIKIAMHGSGAGWDFSSWGTEEDDLLKALDGLTPAQVQEAIKYYNEHLSDGASFMADVAGDMDSDSPEFKVVEAESRGDKVAADTYRLDYAADGWGTDEKLIEETLKAGREGRGGRAKDHLQRLTSRFEATFGQQGGEYHDSKGTGQSALQIMLGDEMEGLERAYFEQLAEKGEADPELELAYSMHGAGTDEERAKKILKEINKLPPEERAAFIRRFEALSLDVLGVDQTLEQWVEGDFSGTEGFELKMLMMGPPKTPEEYLERARMRYDFERSGFVNMIGNGFMDGLEAMGAHSNSSLLNQHMAEIEEMFGPDGKLKNPEAFEELKEVCGWQEQDAANYREVRDKATDYVVTTLQAIGAVVCMIIPGGQAFGAAWIAYLVKFLASMAVTVISMMAKQALGGNGYGWEQAGIDLAQGVLEAATAGLGGMREFQKAAAGAMAVAKGVVQEGAKKTFKMVAKEALEEAVTGGAQSLLSAVITSEQVWEGGGEGELFKHLLKETAMGALKSGTMSFVGEGMKKTPWGKRLEKIEQTIGEGGPKPSFLKQYGLKYINEVATAGVGTALDHNKWEAWAKGEGFDGTLLKGLFIDPAWKGVLQTSISRSSAKRQLEASMEMENAQRNLAKYKTMLQSGDSELEPAVLRQLIAKSEDTIQSKQQLIQKLQGDAVEELEEAVRQKEQQIARGRGQLAGKDIDPDEIGSKTEHIAMRREVGEGLDDLEDQARTVRKTIVAGDVGSDDPALTKQRPVDETSSDTVDEPQRKTRKLTDREAKPTDGDPDADSAMALTPKKAAQIEEIADGTERFAVFDNFEQVASNKAAIIGAKALGDDGDFSPELKAKLEKLGYTVRKNNVIARADTGTQVPLHLEDGVIVAGLKPSGKSKTPTHLANELLPGGSRGEIWKNARGMVGQEVTLDDGRVVRVARVVPTVVREGVDSEGQALTGRRIAIVTEDGDTVYRPVSEFGQAQDPKRVLPAKDADAVVVKPVIAALARGEADVLTGGDTAAATQVFADPAVRRAVNQHFQDAPDAPAERQRQVKNLLDGFGGDFMAAHSSFDTQESKAVKKALNDHRGKLVGSMMAEVQEAFPGLRVKAKRLDPNSPVLTFEFEGAETAHARAFLEEVSQKLFGGSLKKTLGVELSDGPVRVKPQPDQVQEAPKPRKVEGEFKDPIVQHDTTGNKDIVVGGQKWGYQTSFAFESEVDASGAFVMRQRVILVVDDVSDPAVLRTKDDVEKANQTYFNDPAHRIVVDGVERPMKQQLEVVLMSKTDAETLQQARQAHKDAAAAKGEDHGLGADPILMNVHARHGDADSSNLYTEGPAAASDDKYRQMVIAHELGHAIWGLADRYQDRWAERDNPNHNPADPSSPAKIWTISGSRAAEDSQHVTRNKGLMEDFNVSFAEGQQKQPTAKSWEDLASGMEGGLLNIYQKSNKEMPKKADGSYDFALALKRLNPHLAGEDGSYPPHVAAGSDLTLPKLTAPEGWGVTPSNLKQLEWTIEAAKHGRVRYTLGDGSVPDQVVQAEKNKVYEQPKTVLSKRLVRKAEEHGFDTGKLASSEVEIVKRRSTGASTLDTDTQGHKGEVGKATAGAKAFSAKGGIKPQAATTADGKDDKRALPPTTLAGAKKSVDLAKTSKAQLHELGLSDDEVKAIRTQVKGGKSFDIEDFVKANPKLHPGSLGKIARLTGTEDQVVMLTRQRGESPAEAAHRLGLDHAKYGTQVAVKGVAELHNHFKGVLDPEDFPRILFPEAHDADPALAAKLTLAKLREFYDDSPDAGKNANFDGVLRNRDGSMKASAALIKTIIDGPDADVDAMATLRRVMRASAEMPFDYTYDPRGAFMKYLEAPDEGITDRRSITAFVDATVERLASQGIKYVELQGKLTTPGMAPAEFQAICKKHGILVRMLPHLLTADVAVDGKITREGVYKMLGKSADSDEPVSELVAGLDICGPEAGRWSTKSIKQVDIALEALAHEAELAGRPMVLRPHVGEGYSEDSEIRRHGGGPDSEVAQIARNNLDKLLKQLDESPHYVPPPEGKVIVRLGHVTHATDEHIALMKKLGVIAEVNVGSNLATGSLPADSTGHGRLDEHPLIKLMLAGVKTTLSTDAQGVMSTNMGREYGFAADTLDAFRRGETQITLNGKRVSFSDLTPDQQAVLSLGTLHREAVEQAWYGYGNYTRLRDGDASGPGLVGAKVIDEAGQVSVAARAKLEEQGYIVQKNGVIRRKDTQRQAPLHIAEDGSLALGLKGHAKAVGLETTLPKRLGGPIEAPAPKTPAAKVSEDELPGPELTTPRPGSRVTEPKKGDTPLIGLANKVFDPEASAEDAARQLGEQGVPRHQRLSKSERKAETAFADWVQDDPERAMNNAMAMAHALGSADQPMFEVDAMKRLLPDYGAGKDPASDTERAFRLTQNHALHPTAVALARLGFMKRLDELAALPPDHPRRQVLVTNGGCGAGKSELDNAVKNGLGAKAMFGATWDAAGEGDAYENTWILQAARKRGIKVVFGYAEADPTTRYQGVLERAASKGRVVDVLTFINSYVDGADEMKRFMTSPEYLAAVADGQATAFGVEPGEVNVKAFKDKTGKEKVFPNMRVLNPDGPMEAEHLGAAADKQAALDASLRILEDYVVRQRAAGKDPTTVARGALENALKFLPEQSPEVQASILASYERIFGVGPGKVPARPTAVTAKPPDTDQDLPVATQPRKPADQGVEVPDALHQAVRQLDDGDVHFSKHLQDVMTEATPLAKAVGPTFQEFLEKKAGGMPAHKVAAVFVEMVKNAAIGPMKQRAEIESDGAYTYMEDNRDQYSRAVQKALLDGMDDDSVLVLRDRPAGAQDFDGQYPQKSGKVKDTDILHKYEDGRRIITSPEDGSIVTVLSDIDVADYLVGNKWADDSTLEGSSGAGVRMNRNLGTDNIQHGMLTRGLTHDEKATYVINKLGQWDPDTQTFKTPERIIKMLNDEVYLFEKSANHKGFRGAMKLIDAVLLNNPEAYEALAARLPPEIAEAVGMTPQGKTLRPLAAKAPGADEEMPRPKPPSITEDEAEADLTAKPGRGHARGSGPVPDVGLQEPRGRAGKEKIRGTRSYTFVDEDGVESSAVPRAARFGDEVNFVWPKGMPDTDKADFVRAVMGKLGLETANPDLDSFTGWSKGSDMVAARARQLEDVLFDGAAAGPSRDLQGSTHRFTALMHIVESGQLGKLKLSDVVGAQGETVAELYTLWRRGEIGAQNAPDCFDPAKARDMAESIRQHGYISSREQALAAGLIDPANRDEIHAINVLPSEQSGETTPIHQKVIGWQDFVLGGNKPRTQAEWETFRALQLADEALAAPAPKAPAPRAPGWDDELEITAPIPGVKPKHAASQEDELEVTADLPGTGTQRRGGFHEDITADLPAPSRGGTRADAQDVETFRRTNMNYDFYVEDVDRLLRKRPELRALVDEHGLTHEEVVAVYAYSRQDYADINAGLRGQDPEQLAAYRAQIAVTNSALAKLPAARGSVFRRVSAGDWLDDYQEGAVVTEKAYTSTSNDFDTMLGHAGKGSVEFVMRSRTGRDITQLSGKGELENEVLFTPGTRFRVTSRKVDDDGTVVIYMDEEQSQAPARAPRAPGGQDEAPAPQAPGGKKARGGKRAKAEGPLDLDSADFQELRAHGLSKREANKILSFREQNGGAFDFELFAAQHGDHEIRVLATAARRSGREAEAVAAVKLPGEHEAEAAQRVGIDPRDFGPEVKVTRVAELHNHFKGILEAEDFPRLLFPDVEDSQQAAAQTIGLLRQLYRDDPGGELRLPHKKQATELIERILNSSEAETDPQHALRRMMTASREMPFDFTYDPRGLLIDKLEGDGNAEAFVRATAKRLVDDGVTYAELQGKISTPGVSPERFQEICAEEGVKIRMLPQLLTHQFTEGGEGFTDDKLMRLMFGDDYARQAKVPDMIGGVDICGPEAGKWSAAGMDHMERAFSILDTEAQLSGRRLVLRPHVGEGYSGTEGQRRLGVEERSAQAATARHNLELIVTRLEKMQREGTYEAPPLGNVQVRLGHVTATTPELAERMARLGVIAEVNVGSNLITGALPRGKQGQGDRLDQHPLPLLLYYGVKTVLSTDAQGVMATNLPKEYGLADEIIQRFRRGETRITVPDPDDPKSSKVLSWSDLTPEQQQRFDTGFLERTAQQQAAAGRWDGKHRGQTGGLKIRRQKFAKSGSASWQKGQSSTRTAPLGPNRRPEGDRTQDRRALTRADAAETMKRLLDLAPPESPRATVVLNLIQSSGVAFEDLVEAVTASGSTDMSEALREFHEELAAWLERELRKHHPNTRVRAAGKGSSRMQLVVEGAEETEASRTLERICTQIYGQDYERSLGVQVREPEQPRAL